SAEGPAGPGCGAAAALAWAAMASPPCGPKLMRASRVAASIVAASSGKLYRAFETFMETPVLSVLEEKIGFQPCRHGSLAPATVVPPEPAWPLPPAEPRPLPGPFPE